MSTLSERWRNTSRVFRVLLLLLLIMLLLLLCLLVFLQFVLPIIRPTPTPTTPVPTTITVTETAPSTKAPTPTDTLVSPTNTSVVTTETPVTTETTQPTETVSVTIAPTSVTPTETVTHAIEIRNVLRNGNFEEGFQSNQLGNYWNGFNNGSADFSFHIDDWPPVVPEGKHAQLIEIKNAQLTDRYFGIYQTADVIPGQVYTFSMKGLVRTNTGDVEKTSYGYRLQVSFDLTGGQNWKSIIEEDWVELPWDEQLRVQDSFRFDEYTTTLTAESEELTVFIRAWKKWADSGEGDYDVDDIQLVGPARVTPAAPAIPVTGGEPRTIWDNVRIWATVALLLLLLGGALWRLGWKRT
jgi:hypothetical protein